ncbi:MAG: biopolymer transporter ExbB [Rhodocyclales bacterium CG17_big_fil_post_rev_8_21_14_2_50_68_7]|nr:MAG: biopolymer transporter ExbB [Betaproteobacteria bacterium CG2_30_68_42]PIV76074.1 MAG: biopolymer transporter ExbB [Rhodocyclales bacterium CG17_big_fil_post_rev_8_21_14_2_50_68_7]PJA58523.1 MAG: biopolymer transporter ExbB [Rhodocyclales bacterium CG_4_9_14_3_um_filter_68_10]
MESTVDGLGFAHFLTHVDGVGKTVLALLLLLSVASWYLIVTRTLANWLAGRRAAVFEARFRATHALDELAPETDNALSALVSEALGVQQALAGRAADFGEVLTRGLNNAIDREMTRAEHGLTVLATAGSAAPYIGLFGTVWGIYHALVRIGMSGQGTLDKVAGPVGEALIMTALGLAVAIPAVLAYNAFQRRNRMWLNRLESFAHELYLLLAVEHGQG